MGYYDCFPIKYTFQRKDIIPMLLEDKIIREQGKDPGDSKMRYRLGVEGIKLVEQWSVERLTKLVMVLTIGLFILGFIQIILLIIFLPS